MFLSFIILQSYRYNISSWVISNQSDARKYFQWFNMPRWKSILFQLKIKHPSCKNRIFYDLLNTHTNNKTQIERRYQHVKKCEWRFLCDVMIIYGGIYLNSLESIEMKYIVIIYFGLKKIKHSVWSERNLRHSKFLIYTVQMYCCITIENFCMLLEG